MTNKRNSNELHESKADTLPSERKKAKLEPNPTDEKADHSMSFPELLMHIIDHDKESKGTIVWKDDGCTFWISTKEFIQEVLQVRFTGSKFESFIRKLNRWGFKRMHDQSLPYGTIAYRHSLFKRGYPEMLKNMSGVKKKETASNAPRLLGERDKRLSDQVGELLHPSKVSFSNVASNSLEQSLLQKQMLQLIGHSATSPFLTPMNNMRQGFYRLSTTFPPLNDTEILLNQLLQQRIARLSEPQVPVASFQLAAAPISRVTVSAEPTLLRLQQQLNNGFVL